MLIKPEATEKIIGCAMRVHSKIGNGFQEVIYQRCLEINWIKLELITNVKWKCRFITMSKKWELGGPILLSGMGFLLN